MDPEWAFQRRTPYHRIGTIMLVLLNPNDNYGLPNVSIIIVTMSRKHMVERFVSKDQVFECQLVDHPIPLSVCIK
jgi:hypothetical protein